MTPQEQDAWLDSVMPRVLRFMEMCLEPKPPRNAQSGLAVCKMVIDRKMPPVQKSEIHETGERKIIVEIVRPLALTDGQDTRQTRVPARVIDAD